MAKKTIKEIVGDQNYIKALRIILKARSNFNKLILENKKQGK